MSENVNNDIRIGVYVCHCGLNIAGVVDCKHVAEYAASLPNVVLAIDNTYTCSEPGQNRIKEDIAVHNLNRIVVASCSPRLHESTFRQCIKEAGLNPYLLEMANLREHCSWVHGHDKKGATRKARDLVRAAVARCRLLTVRREDEIPVKTIHPGDRRRCSRHSVGVGPGQCRNQGHPGGEKAQYRRYHGRPG